LREAYVGSIGYVLVPCRGERGRDLTCDRAGAIEGSMPTIEVDAAGAGGIAALYNGLLKTSFWAAWDSTFVGRMAIEEVRDRAGLSLLCA